MLSDSIFQYNWMEVKTKGIWLLIGYTGANINSIKISFKITSREILTISPLVLFKTIHNYYLIIFTIIFVYEILIKYFT